MKVVKIVLLALVALVLLMVVAVLSITYGFDANKYKPELIDSVKAKTGRTLTIDEPLRLSLFPKLAITIGKAQLSEQGGARNFAKVGEIRASLALLPLLSKQVVVDRVVLTGLSANLVRFKDGHTNFDDLMATGGGRNEPAKSAGAAKFKIDIQGIELSADSLAWSDEKAGTRVRMSAVKIETGRIADDLPGKLVLSAHIQGEAPRMDALINISSAYRFSLERKAFDLSSLDLKVTGDVPGAAGLSAALKGSIESDPERSIFKLKGIDLNVTTKDGVEARLFIPGLEYSPERISSEKASGSLKLARNGMNVDAKVALAAVQTSSDAGKAGAGRDGAAVIHFPEIAIDFSGKQSETAFQGRLLSRLTVRPHDESVQMAGINGEVNASGPAIPQRALKVALTGQVDGNWARKTATGNMLAKIDESTVRTQFDLKAADSRPAIGFDVDIDQINVDRYMRSGPGTAGAGAAKGPATSSVGGADAPIDLSGLKPLNLRGQVRAGRVTAANVKIEKLNATVKASDGRLDIAPLSAALYGGSLTGAIGVNANGNHLSVRQQLSGVNIGPLIKDAVAKDFIEGRGNVTLDLNTQGPTISSLKKALAGTAAINLKDGAIKGINLAESFRNAKALLGSKSAREQSASASDKTDFAELSATFRIQNGVAHNDDLALKSPFLRLGGAGDIDIGASRIDYLAKASVVATSGGQGGKDASELRGLNIPVRLVGPFDALKYRIDFGAVATEAVKQQVQEKVKEQLQDRLKGLLKR
jgi:AsmA protein